MLSTDLITHRREGNLSHELKHKCYQDSLILEPAFEISIIFGRSLLNFLGISYDPKTNDLIVHQPRENDLTMKDIYPNKTLCPLTDQLLVDNKKSLCTIIKLANKSVAHLTTLMSSEEEHGLLKDARFTIYRLMLKYVPDVNKAGIWWYQQVEHV